MNGSNAKCAEVTKASPPEKHVALLNSKNDTRRILAVAYYNWFGDSELGSLHTSHLILVFLILPSASSSVILKIILWQVRGHRLHSIQNAMMHESASTHNSTGRNDTISSSATARCLNSVSISFMLK